jgi:CPA1 family monovalent cation:H+ antiporter
MRTVFRAVSGWPFSLLLSYGLGISLLVIGLRFVWVYSASFLTRRIGNSLGADNMFRPSWRHLFFVGWAGIRGAISLVAAFAIPLSLPSGQAFPMRDLIIFITFCVILVTLVLQGMSLPFLIRWLDLAREGRAEQEQAAQMECQARAELIEAALQRLDAFFKENSENAAMASPYRQQLHHQRLELEHIMQGRRDGGLKSWTRHDFAIHQAILDAEREKLFVLYYREGRINDDVFHLIEHDLDLQEVRLHEHRLSDEI